MKRIMIFRPKAIDAETRAMLESNDIIVVELMRPSDVVTIQPFDELVGDDICLAALNAMNKYPSGNANAEFVSGLYKRLQARKELIASFTPTKA